MNPMPPFTITPVLREAAEHRIDELNRAKESFKRRYHMDSRRAAETNTVKRVSGLLEDIKKLDPYLENDDDLSIMSRYIEQAQDDRSISGSKLLKFEEQLWDKLNKHLNRLEVSSLHVDLMKEVMDAETPTGSAAARLEKAAIDDEFEMVETELEEVQEIFEADTFHAKSVDVEAIEAYLSSLFTSDRSKRCLEDLRDDMIDHGETLMDGNMEMDQDILMWIIMDLLKNDLISPDKKRTLGGYLQSPIALRELVATINMKSFRHWDYKDVHKGLRVTARQNAEGQYCITVEEDIIDMLFLHCTAIGWASKLKGCLKDFVRSSKAFAARDLTVEEVNKREYFLMPTPAPVEPPPIACSMCHPYYPFAPMPPPPPPPPPESIVVVSRKPRKRRVFDMPPPPPPPNYPNLDGERNRAYIRDFFMSRLPSQEGCTPKVTRPEEIQANLIKTLATEARLRAAFDGQAYAFGARFNSLATSLPHQTIITVLRFLGVPAAFLDFFTRFLETKLNIGPSVPGTPDRILKRACGVPVGHSLEMFFSEAVLFFLELCVHQKTDSYMYRLYDRCYFVGTKDQRHRCVVESATFTRVMGLKPQDTSPVMTIGHLMTKDALRVSRSSPGVFEIKNSKVDMYARRIKKQLAACTTVIEWIRVWNSTVGTYAAHLFGPLADVFGKSHLEAVKVAYNRIFSVIFDGGNLTAHIKSLLQPHVRGGLNDSPFAVEALIYLPHAYGGLGVKNPFISLNLARNIYESPDAEIEKYMKTEETYYTSAAKKYGRFTAEQRQQKLACIFDNNEDSITAALGPDRDLTLFMTRDELTNPRDRTTYPNLPPPGSPVNSPSLVGLYQDLLREPINNIDVSDKVRADVYRLSDEGDMQPWRKLSGEDRWVLQMYSDECFEHYGTLEVWWSDGVPTEVYKALRGHVWDDGDDDGSSYASSAI